VRDGKPYGIWEMEWEKGKDRKEIKEKVRM
jgi:hypothetical protein